jgi:hypothetical protein
MSRIWPVFNSYYSYIHQRIHVTLLLFFYLLFDFRFPYVVFRGSLVFQKIPAITLSVNYSET